jgi:hypothetical protein
MCTGLLCHPSDAVIYTFLPDTNNFFYFNVNRKISNCIFSECNIRSSCCVELSFLYDVTYRHKIGSLFSQWCLLLLEVYLQTVAVVFSENSANFTGLKDVPKRVLLTVTFARPPNSKWFFCCLCRISKAIGDANMYLYKMVFCFLTPCG